MRGKLAACLPISASLGLIPAHAGKTVKPEYEPTAYRAHPRACGENRFPRLCVASLLGSSPRMRGKLTFTSRVRYSLGLIPAHAGKTPLPWAESSPTRAHPRACGENLIRPWIMSLPTGSSPRMRGKPAAREGLRVRVGLIPAHAGKTLNDLEF